MLTLALTTLLGSGLGISFPPLTIQDEGVGLPVQTRLNFAGSPVSCVDDPSNGRTTCTFTGGGANTVEYSAAFGTTARAGLYTFTVTGQTWVTATSVIVCAPLGTAADGLTAEAIALAELRPVVSARVAGTGFTLNVYNPHGLAGTVRLQCLGQ